MTEDTPAFDAAATATTASLRAWEQRDWGSMARPELLAAHRELAGLRRRVDALLATASAEVARRSGLEDGPAGLARREGFASAERLVASSTGGSTAEASRLIEVGRATLAATEVRAAGSDGVVSNGTAADDDAIGPRLLVLAEAVRDGRISIDAASAISAMLRRVAPTAAPEAVDAVERDLVERAPTLPLDRLAAVIRQHEARLDLAAHEQRERLRREARYLNIFESRTGMVVIDGRLDVETAAPVRAALDALVGESLRRRRDQANSAGHGAGEGQASDVEGSVPADERTVPQMRADALADLSRHALGCDQADRTLATTTVVVRVGLEELRTGEGLGQIDGCDEPVSVGVLRRMTADAEVLPVVLGGDSEVLDLGRARRLFTRAQRIALGERDGGCAHCHAPPSWTEAHHIRWWERDAGPTDLSNGILLCSSCHHRVHRDGWDIDVKDDGTVWFVPPRSVDPEREPVLGGRARFEATASLVA